jgi:hypothetical protein
VQRHGNHGRRCSFDSAGLVAAFADRHRSEQNFTLSQSRSHFLRQAKGRWHEAQILVGRFSFLCAMPKKRAGDEMAAAKLVALRPVAGHDDVLTGKPILRRAVGEQAR